MSKKDKDKLEQARTALERKYKNLTVSVSWNFPPKVQSVVLNLTPEEWVGCLDKEGEYLPVCCGNISRVRDILFTVIRESGYIGVEELHEASYLLRSHHDKPNRVQNKIIALWEAVKEDADIRPTCRVFDPTLLEDAVEMLSSGVHRLAWDHFGQQSKKQHFQRQVNWQYEFYRMYPAFTTVMAAMRAKDELLPIFQGWAICEDGLVLELNHGLAVFEEQKYAEEIVADFMKYRPKRLTGKRRRM